jgi:uncharacterized protein YgbK (DUF1537 family)
MALKTRTVPAQQAITETLAALDWLGPQAQHPVIFKVCSTFDSTDQGNIGPVGDALLQRLGADVAIVCPASPANGRTIYLGHLFVHDSLLHESPMAEHPLTPMRDSNLVRLLQRQSRHQARLVPLQTVRSGADAVRAAVAEMTRSGARYAVVDAACEADLASVAGATSDMPLWISASGLPAALPAIAADRAEERWPEERGPVAVLAGSCSSATRQQVARFADGHPAVQVQAPAVLRDRGYADKVIDHALRHLDSDGTVLVYASAPPDVVAAAQALAEPGLVAARVEEVMGRVAAAVVAKGVTRLVVAGGETSGAVLTALGVQGLTVGATIAPGVPWMRAVDSSGLWLALKSGNFGGPSFFLDAIGDQT